MEDTSNSLEGQVGTTGLLEKSGDLEIGRGETARSSVFYTFPEAPSLLMPGCRHPSPAIPLERPLIEEPEKVIPYPSRFPEHKHLEIRNKCENWLLANEVVNGEFIEFSRRVRITSDGWNMIEPERHHDYHPLLFAYLLADERHYEKLGKFEDHHIPGKAPRYLEAELAWLAVHALMHKAKTGRWPSVQEKIQNSIKGINYVFRPYFILKENALGEEVRYPWARDLVRRVHHEMHID